MDAALVCGRRPVTAGRHQAFDAAYFEEAAVTKSPEAAQAYATLLQLARRSTVADIGCAKGSIVAELQRATTWRMIGLDVSLAALKEVPPGTPLCCASADQLPLGTGTLDGALFLDVIEHLESPLAALTELHRVVKPGGMLVVTTPNAGSALRPMLGRRWHGLEDDTHLYFFTAFSLTHLMAKSGWQPCRVLTRSGAAGVVGRLLALSRSGGELCVLATAVA